MSRFTKKTFPEKWKIQITEENFDIVTPYYAEVSTTYTTKQHALNEWIQSHNFVNETPSYKAGVSFFGNDDEFTPITVEEFKEFLLMREFILPERWWLKVTTREQDEVLTEYCNKKFNTNTGGVADILKQPIFYYSEIIDVLCWTVGDNKADESFTKITYDQFVKYVLNEKPITEDHSQLIKLLNDVL